MKVLFFIESLHAGGKERRLVELIKGLANTSDIKMELVLTQKNIHYTDILDLKVKIHYTIRTKFKKDPKIFYKFYKIASKFKPDIIHVWGHMVAVYAIPTKKWLRIPMINNQITSAPKMVPEALLDHRLTFKHSDKIIANSKAGLASFDAPKNKSLVIYNGFNFDRLKNLSSSEEIKAKFGIKTKYLIGMVATFCPEKDHIPYILAANEVLKKFNDVTFICVGAGDSSSVENLVPPKNAKNILFLGRQNNIESIMNACDIDVLLSTDGEGISNAILEFLALEKPVIATRAGGNPELITDNKNGYLLDKNDPNILADKINYLLENTQIIKDFGTNGRKNIEENFSIAKMLADFKQAYNHVLIKI